MTDRSIEGPLKPEQLFFCIRFVLEAHQVYGSEITAQHLSRIKIQALTWSFLYSTFISFGAVPWWIYWIVLALHDVV